MAESTTTPQSSTTTAPPDSGDFRQVFKLGPVIQAKALRDQIDLAQRNAERVYEAVHGLPTQLEKKAQDDVIQVDSPTTNVTHNYPAPAAQPAGLSTLGKIAAGVGLAMAAGTPIGAGLVAIPIVQALLNRPTQVVTQPTATPQPLPTVDQTLYDLRLGKPAE